MCHRNNQINVVSVDTWRYNEHKKNEFLIVVIVQGLIFVVQIAPMSSLWCLHVLLKHTVFFSLLSDTPAVVLLCFCWCFSRYRYSYTGIN